MKLSYALLATVFAVSLGAVALEAGCCKKPKTTRTGRCGTKDCGESCEKKSKRCACDDCDCGDNCDC